MRAATIDRYGPPEQVRVVEARLPVRRAGEVLVRVAAAAVTSGDARIRGAHFPPGFAPFARMAFGLRGPRRHVLGTTFSGTVEEVGPGAEGFAPGDEVCGMTGMRMGAHAEFVVAPSRKLARKPDRVSHDDAAGVLFGGTTALHFLRDKARVSPGQTVLVNGASGAIGTNAVQLARYFGATVTAVTSAANAPLVRELGAVAVVDHHAADISTLEDRFDVVFDAVGNLSIPGGRRLLAEGGTLLLAVAGLGDTLRARGDVIAGTTPERVEDFDVLLGLVADGALRVVLQEIVPLDDIVAAHRIVDSGRKVGNVIVRPV